jgi:putative membrane protein
LLCGGFGVFISLLHFFNLPVSMPILSSIVPSIVLGLLLVFRTNTAYERFWEGRKAWGTLVNNVRNLARQIWVAIEEKDPQDIEVKKSVLRLLPAFAVALKLHLRQEAVNPELEPLMSPAQYQKLKSMNNPPLEIAFWIEDYMHEQYERNCLDVYQLTGMNQLLNSMIDVLGGCERILKTPIPLAYAIHLKQLLLLYCLALPFQMVKDLTWGTGLVVALISFTLFGIEEIGIEIENPFGHDDNDLPLNNICAAMQRNMDDLISLSPSVHEQVKDK